MRRVVCLHIIKYFLFNEFPEFVCLIVMLQTMLNSILPICSASARSVLHFFILFSLSFVLNFICVVETNLYVFIFCTYTIPIKAWKTRQSRSNAASLLTIRMWKEYRTGYVSPTIFRINRIVSVNIMAGIQRSMLAIRNGKFPFEFLVRVTNVQHTIHWKYQWKTFLENISIGKFSMFQCFIQNRKKCLLMKLQYKIFYLINIEIWTKII